MSTQIQKSLSVLTENTRKKVEVFLKIARSEWLDIFVWESRRTQDRQNFLFGKWRTAQTLGYYWVPTYYANPSADQVTWTLNSKHLSWKAVDIVFDLDLDPKIEYPVWSGDYARLIEIGKMCWLRNLAPSELCHFEDNWEPFSINYTIMSKYKEVLDVEIAKGYEPLFTSLKWDSPLSEADVKYLLEIHRARGDRRLLEEIQIFINNIK